MEPTTFSIISFDNRTAFDLGFIVPDQKFFATMIPNLDIVSVLRTLGSIVTVTIIWRLLFIILLIGNLKNLPLIWHMRYVNGIRFVLRSQRSENRITPAQLFKPLITSSHAPLMEIDFNIHKSNSSYFSDIDICRTHIVSTLFAKGIELMRGGTEAVVIGSDKPLFGLALGGVSCNFKREIKPYEAYEMWTRVLSWDEKWIYIVTHFVRKDASKDRSSYLYPEQQVEHQTRENGAAEKFDPKSGIYASALSKCVFKSGRKTISPEFMLRASGLLPPATSPQTELAEQLDAKSGRESGWSMENIEDERQRGMEAALILSMQNQQALEDEFCLDSEILGRHSDGTGITGVISTLAQLARIKKRQVL